MCIRDSYERHLFYSSGSSSWPKGNNTVPYENLTTDDNTTITWYNSELQDATLYDASNPDILINTIPAYLVEDENNRPYELFIHMIAQHFDNLWLYTNAVSKKYDNDNRLNRGVSKDLVEDLLKNFGVKLYTSNRSAQDLFRYFTANSYDIVDSEPNLEPVISGSNFPVSQNDYQKEIYKRIYHNLPLLMKSKGTERGLRALINCFGIPSDILKIRIHGGRSSEDLPFFAGDRPYTGSVDKVRLNNSGSIVPGDTLSQYTSIINPDNFYTQDLHNIEVGFSPSYNINEYIVSQSAVLFPNTPFDIDDYIGDPRGYETSKYLPLYAYAETVLADVETYDLKDFVRLIKFFDNVIFRMVRDFVPARAVADTGIIIKPHLLDRSKFKSPVMTWTRPEYSGSINTAFISGSHGSTYKSVGFGASGSLFKQESSTRYRELVKTPSGSKYKKWSTRLQAPGGYDYIELNPVYDRMQDQAKFDGELSGSHIQVTNGELNEDNPYKELRYRSLTYDIKFFHAIPDNICILGGLGTEENPYILRYPTPGGPTSQTWDVSQFFEFAAIDGHDYRNEFEDDIDNPLSYPFVLEFGGANEELNYLETSLTAEKLSLQSCTAVTHIMKVICELGLTDSLPDNSTVFTYLPYNLFLLFNSIYNTDTDILVNNTVLSDEQAENFTFSGGEGASAEIVIRDGKDNTCFNLINVTVSSCALRLYASQGGQTNDFGGFIDISNGPVPDTNFSNNFSPDGQTTPPPGSSAIYGFDVNQDGEITLADPQEIFTFTPARNEFMLDTVILGGDVNTIWQVIFEYSADTASDFGGINEDGTLNEFNPEDPNINYTDPVDLIFAPDVIANLTANNFYRMVPTMVQSAQEAFDRYYLTVDEWAVDFETERIKRFSIIARSQILNSCVVQTPFFKLEPPEPGFYFRVRFIRGTDYASACSPVPSDSGGFPPQTVSVYVAKSNIPNELLGPESEGPLDRADRPQVRRYIMENSIQIYNNDDFNPGPPLKPVYQPEGNINLIYLGDNVTADSNEDGYFVRKYIWVSTYVSLWDGNGQYGMFQCGYGQ